jgi:hypothetical protein
MEEVAMSDNAPKHTPRFPSLAINPKPISIRSLDYRRGLQADVVDRVRGEFVEMCGFSPTVEQASRLFDLPPDECGRILGGLVQEGFLRRTADGRYRRPA